MPVPVFWGQALQVSQSPFSGGRRPQRMPVPVL